MAVEKTGAVDCTVFLQADIGDICVGATDPEQRCLHLDTRDDGGVALIIKGQP